MQQLSALTASSQLTYLRINSYEYACLPEDALRHMLPAGKLLPYLQELSLQSVSEAFPEDLEDFFQFTPIASTADVSSIARCCPGLVKLSLCRIIWHEREAFAGLTALQPSLHVLHIDGAALDIGAARAIAQLTGLQELCWGSTSTVGSADLRPLTALRGLTHLEVSAPQRCTVLGHEDLVLVQNQVGLNLFLCWCLAFLAPRVSAAYRMCAQDGFWFTLQAGVRWPFVHTSAL